MFFKTIVSKSKTEITSLTSLGFRRGIFYSSSLFQQNSKTALIPAFTDIINRPSNSQHNLIPEYEQVRVTPTSPTFFASNPPHELNMLKLNEVLNKYISFPYDASQNKSGSWISMKEYAMIGGGSRLKIVHHQELVSLLNRIAAIDPQLQNDEITNALQPFKKQDNSTSSTLIRKQLDEFGRAVCVGRRKASSAKVYLVKGSGEFLVNNKSLNEVFPSLADRLKILFPLKVVDAEGSYNVFAKVRGGGTTGQAGAIVSAIAQGLIIHNPLLKARLYKAGCMTKDHRVVERKKAGKRKARKSPTWVKR